MLRLFLALVVSLCCFSAANAHRSPATEHQPFRGDLSRVKLDTPSEQKKELTITAETEVKLDGQTCKFADVPRDAEVILIEVHRSVIRKVHFRSKK